MKKIFTFFTGLVMAVASLSTAFLPAQAAVNVVVAPATTITSPVTLPANSAQTQLFSFSLSNTATETLSSILVEVDKANASTTIAGSHIASLSLYKDDGSNAFNPIAGNLIGTQTLVNIGSTSTINSLATTTPATGKFYVSLATAGSWSGTAPADSIMVTMPANAITTSANSPTTSSVSTATISAVTTGPVLLSAAAQNTGGTSAKEAGDSVVLTFNEPTNKPVISSSTINTFFSLNNGHSFLDANGNLGGAAWDSTGTMLTLTLSGSGTSTIPSVMVGDIVSMASSTGITDSLGNVATGAATITGNFGVPSANPGLTGPCPNGLTNGKIYHLTGTNKYYIAANCSLKIFKGKIRGKGKKFVQVIEINSLTGLVVTVTPPTPKHKDDDKNGERGENQNSGKNSSLISGQVQFKIKGGKNDK